MTESLRNVFLNITTSVKDYKVFFVLFWFGLSETGSLCVTQASLELLASKDLPARHSGSHL